MTDQTSHDRLRQVLLGACAEHDIQAEVSSEPGPLRWRFAGQENADGGLMAGVFLEELGETGQAGALALDPAEMDEETLARTEAALRHSVARLRTLLIEHNSWLSGGLRWPFAGAQPALVERGLAVYRFPATAEVDVVSEGEQVRISFAPTTVDATISSGFYVPTRVRGDFEVELRYELGPFEPGADAASFALFTQDQGSVLRYYAQRRATRDGRHEVLANFSNTVMSAAQSVDGASGTFRLRRRGEEVTSWHRTDGDWQQLGEHAGDPAHDMIVGSKIWTTTAAGALEARALELRIDGEIPQDQIDPVPVRPDPRQG